MNRVVLSGRLCADAEVRYSQGQNAMAIARYRLAVDRPVKRDQNNPNQQTADFISCVAFGRNAEFAQKYMTKGRRFIIAGHIQTGSYTNKDGQKVYTTDVIVESQEFADSKPQSDNHDATGDEWMHIPDGADDEALPFN